VLATDDDGGTGLSSRIERELPPGEYTVLVRAFGTGAGRLVLNASGATAAGPADDEVLLLGAQVSGELASGAEQTFDLLLDARTDLVLSTEGSDFDTVLSLHNVLGEQIASDDDGGPGTTSLITRQLGVGRYRVRLRGFGSESGTYVFSIGDNREDSGTSEDSDTRGGLVLDRVHSSQLDANGEVGMPFHAPLPGRYVFSTAGSNFDTVLSLLDSRGNTLARDDDGGEGVTSRIEQMLAPGEYRVVANGFGASSGQLQLLVTDASRSSSPASPIVGGDLYSPATGGGGLGGRRVPAARGDESSPLPLIQLSGNHRERGVLESGAEQWFSLQVHSPAIWEFSTGGSDFDTILALYDPAGEEVARDDDGGGGTSSLVRHNLTPGLWRLQLTGFGQSSGSYLLAGEAFSSLGIEALTLGQPHTSELSAGQELEFELNLTREAEYSISTEGSGFDTVLSLHNVLGEQIASDDDGGTGTTSLITLQLEAGNYLVRVRGFSSTASGPLNLTANAMGQSGRAAPEASAEHDAAGHDAAGHDAAGYDAIQLQNARLNLRVIELEVESQTRAAAANLQAARFFAEESQRALEIFAEHEAPLEVARHELALDRARAGFDLVEAEVAALEAKMDEGLPSVGLEEALTAQLHAKQRELGFARRELELTEVSMELLVEIELERRRRELEQGVSQAQAEVEAAERALEVAELLGQIAINEAQQWAGGLHSMPIELPDGPDFEYEIF